MATQAEINAALAAYQAAQAAAELARNA